jgi:hypothetical protein
MARQRRSGWAWWTVEHGGAPRWLFALLVLVLVWVGVLWLAISAQRSASTASSGAPAAAVESTAPAATPTPTPTPTPEPYVISVIGDAYTSGSAANAGPAWPQLTNVPNVNVLAVPDVGYAAENPDAPGTTFVTQAEQVSPDTDLVVFFGSRNDPVEYDAVYEAASAAYATALARAPEASLLVIGPLWGEDGPTDEELTTLGAVRDAATAVGARWVDPVAESWFPPESGLIADDGVNPNDTGQLRLAERIAPLLAPA